MTTALARPVKAGGYRFKRQDNGLYSIFDIEIGEAHDFRGDVFTTERMRRIFNKTQERMPVGIVFIGHDVDIEQPAIGRCRYKWTQAGRVKVDYFDLEPQVALDIAYGRYPGRSLEFEYPSFNIIEGVALLGSSRQFFPYPEQRIEPDEEQLEQLKADAAARPISWRSFSGETVKFTAWRRYGKARSAVGKKKQDFEDQDNPDRLLEDDEEDKDDRAFDESKIKRDEGGKFSGDGSGSGGGSSASVGVSSHVKSNFSEFSSGLQSAREEFEELEALANNNDDDEAFNQAVDVVHRAIDDVVDKLEEAGFGDSDLVGEIQAIQKDKSLNGFDALVAVEEELKSARDGAGDGAGDGVGGGSSGVFNVPKVGVKPSSFSNDETDAIADATDLALERGIITEGEWEDMSGLFSDPDLSEQPMIKDDIDLFKKVASVFKRSFFRQVYRKDRGLVPEVAEARERPDDDSDAWRELQDGETFGSDATSTQEQLSEMRGMLDELFARTQRNSDILSEMGALSSESGDEEREMEEGEDGEDMRADPFDDEEESTDDRTFDDEEDEEASRQEPEPDDGEGDISVNIDADDDEGDEMSDDQKKKRPERSRGADRSDADRRIRKLEENQRRMERKQEEQELHNIIDNAVAQGKVIDQDLRADYVDMAMRKKPEDRRAALDRAINATRSAPISTDPAEDESLSESVEAIPGLNDGEVKEVQQLMKDNPKRRKEIKEEAEYFGNLRQNEPTNSSLRYGVRNFIHSNAVRERQA